ncbi:SGNH/GDSL hydrolase family protein [soil metagenome]
MAAHVHSLLCLGDSYTIGETLPLHESFPYQLLQLLRQMGVHFHAPEIVAQTGWTTTELAEHLIHHKLQDHYDFVTLLIGVNNQYRALDLDDYAEDFEFLTKKAIHLAKGHAQCVIIVSIPDWGVSPFAKGENTKKIAAGIDDFNEVNSNIAFKYDCTYFDITAGTRMSAGNELFAKDELHYAAREYGRWALDVADKIKYLIA